MAVDHLAIPANNIICSLTDPEGRSLGASLDLPQDAGPKELHLLVNTLLQNVSAQVLNDITGPGPGRARLNIIWYGNSFERCCIIFEMKVTLK